MAVSPRRHPKRVPGGAAVHADLASRHRLLQHPEGRPESILQLVAAGLAGQGMTRVVDVIDVYSAEPEVLAALGNAVAEKARSEAVSTANDLIGLQNLLIDELALNVALVLLARRWRGAIERDISALGTDYELVARTRRRRQ